MPRVVLLRMKTTDGRVHRMQVPLRQFHQLRYSAAKARTLVIILLLHHAAHPFVVCPQVLQEMNQAESHPIMRLAYNERSSP